MFPNFRPVVIGSFSMLRASSIIGNPVLAAFLSIFPSPLAFNLETVAGLSPNSFEPSHYFPAKKQ